MHKVFVGRSHMEALNPGDLLQGVLFGESQRQLGKQMLERDCHVTAEASRTQ